MNAFLRSPLFASFARQNPSVEISVSPRGSAHPIIRGEYVNGREKVICVRNMRREEVLEKAVLLRDASGEKLRKRTKRGVVSSGGTESVRGVWSPFHGGRYQI